jgi:hypothetical protein
MTNPMTVIHNVETGEIVEREMNAEELAQYEKDKIAVNAQRQAEAAKATERVALLAKLGITEDEARLLLGGN